MQRIWNPKFPFDPAKWPFFYGWMILFMAIGGFISSIPGQTMGVSVFTDTLVEVLGVTRIQLTTAYLIGTAVSGCFVARSGQLFDSLGGRRFIVLSCFLLGMALVFMSQMDRLAAFLGLAGFTVAAMAVSSLAFLGIRLFGQGMVTLGSRSMLAKWWNLRRGLVAAISGCFVAFGFSIAPRILDWEIQAFGWRGAILVNAGAIGIGMALAGWLFFRDNPEECGLEMDNGWRPKRRHENPDTFLGKEFTRSEARNTYAYWVLTLMLGFHGLFTTAYTFHVIDLGRSFSVGKDTMLNFFIYSSFFSILTNLLAGYITDRIRIRFVISFMALCGVLYCLGILMLPTSAGMGLLVIGMGSAWGTFPVLSNVGYARYFGRAHIGAISGSAMAWLVWGSALGPLLFSASKRYLGGYGTAVTASLLLYALLAIGGAFVRNPSRQSQA